MSTTIDTYYNRKHERSCEVCKEEQRQRVLKWFKRYNQPSPDGWSYLGFPGTSWAFEKDLFNELSTTAPCVEITALEWSKKIYPDVVTRCPFEGKRHVHTHGPNGPDGSYTAFDRGRIINLGASKFLKWDDRFTPEIYTCAWFDFTSSLCKEVFQCCRQLSRWVSLELPLVFAISFTKGRETKKVTEWLRTLTQQPQKSLAFRCEPLKFIMEAHSGRKIELLDTWQYKSPSGATIGNMCGIMLPKLF